MSAKTSRADSSTADNAGGTDRTDRPISEQQLGPSQMVTGMTSVAAESNRTEENCIRFTPIGDAPHTEQLIKRLQVLLDPQKVLGGDVKSLADKFGYTGNQISFLMTKPSPTEVLLRDYGHCTVDELLNKLKSIGRNDAVESVKEYLESECKCENCSSPTC